MAMEGPGTQVVDPAESGLALGAEPEGQWVRGAAASAGDVTRGPFGSMRTTSTARPAVKAGRMKSMVKGAAMGVSSRAPGAVRMKFEKTAAGAVWRSL
ncbi:MAG: hypothetical protein JWM90_3072 [Thermoleophilia bacterium]|nr:hypothetical protein [Thermoleophilia bacterium]